MRTYGTLVRRLIIIAIVVYGATLIPFVRDWVRTGLGPVIRVVRQSTEGTLSNFGILFNISTLAHENGQLRVKVNELTALEIANTELKHENDLLREELSLTTSAHSKSLIAAQVISRSSSVSQQTIVINKGHDDGFVSGMPIIAQGYLVGRVDEALSNTSRVMLLSSVDSLLPVVLQNSRSVGLLKGGAGGLLLDEIPRDVTIDDNEAVVTSNIGDIVKSGIPIGKVAAVISGKSDIFQSARVTSPIDLSRLEIVFGVK
jgi:rod shape-determining protein MreC